LVNVRKRFPNEALILKVDAEGRRMRDPTILPGRNVLPQFVRSYLNITLVAIWSASSLVPMVALERKEARGDFNTQGS